MEKDRLADSLSIRSIGSIEELTMVRDLEKLIWHDDDPVPVHQTLTAVKNGGVMIGAFARDKLIGFQYSFAGFDGTKAYLCSHTMGIHPDYRISGIGEQLKLAQRMEAIGKGYDLITWTFDPLETVNGNLNIRKLGATCSRYIDNCYGDMTDILNAGVPSDRFQVEWRIASENVNRHLTEGKTRSPAVSDAPPIIRLTIDDHGFPVPVNADLSFDQLEAKLLVPVPAEFQQIKAADLELAIRWRMQTREVFTHYFQRGWEVVGFINKAAGSPVHYYVLQNP